MTQVTRTTDRRNGHEAVWIYRYGQHGIRNLKGTFKDSRAGSTYLSARNKEHMERVSAETGVSYAKDNVSCAKESTCLILAVKPQQFDPVIGEIRDVVTENQIIIRSHGHFYCKSPGVVWKSLPDRSCHAEYSGVGRGRHDGSLL